MPLHKASLIYYYRVYGGAAIESIRVAFYTKPPKMGCRGFDT
jgi:hypothetical protein